MYIEFVNIGSKLKFFRLGIRTKIMLSRITKINPDFK